MKLLRFLTLGAALTLPFAAHAQITSSTANLAISANIVNGATMTQLSPLSFGDVIPDFANPGTVSVQSGGSVTYASTTQGTNTASRGRFAAYGPGTSTTYSTSAPTVSLVEPVSGSQMLVSNFSFSVISSGVLGANIQEIGVGADLSVAANQTPGLYSGIVAITTTWN